MFAVECDDLGREVLVPMSDVVGIENHDGVVVMEYRCWCGTPGLLVTGKGAGIERSGHADNLLLV